MPQCAFKSDSTGIFLLFWLPSLTLIAHIGVRYPHLSFQLCVTLMTSSKEPLVSAESVKVGFVRDVIGKTLLSAATDPEVKSACKSDTIAAEMLTLSNIQRVALLVVGEICVVIAQYWSYEEEPAGISSTLQITFLNMFIPL